MRAKKVYIRGKKKEVLQGFFAKGQMFFEKLLDKIFFMWYTKYAKRT